MGLWDINGPFFEPSALERMQEMIEEQERIAQIMDGFDFPALQQSIAAAESAMRILDAAGGESVLERALQEHERWNGGLGEAVERLWRDQEKWGKILDRGSDLSFRPDALVSAANGIPAFVVEAMDAALAYVPEERREDCEVLAAPLREAAWEKRLTLDQVLALLNLLLALVMFVVSSLPDPQLDHLTEQNDMLIAQNEAVLEQGEESLDLQRQQLEETRRTRQVLEQLAEAHQLLRDEADALLEQAEQEAAQKGAEE